LGVQLDGDSKLLLGPSIATAAESSAADVAVDGGLTDPEPCRDVSDQVAGEVGAQELVDLVWFEPSLD
jgi:hypothetical protein